MRKILLSLTVAGLVLAQPAKQATHIDSAKMDAAYPKHGTPVDHGAYRVMAIGRDKDGQAEIHAKDTDVVYFVEGTATLVTGGTVKDAKDTAAGEVRGSGLQGGERRPLKKGDVIAIPNGTPHRFVDIKAPCRYYLVKVRTNDKGKPVSVTAFSKGGSLGSGDGFKIGASHRDKDGIAEVHTRDTDVMYFIQGSVTLVTGGSTADPKNSGPEEVRGPKINSGVRQTVKAGDVMVVPNTVPHQFVDVKGPLDYMVVKVRSAN